ncbi:MAG: HepT-like ribonuclease domain-containing protein [Patescibacteria group bacterium]
MNTRDTSLYIKDVLEYCDRAISGIGQMTLDEFRNDVTAQDALARRLEIIGEAAKHIPDSIRSKYQEVEWRKATALRDVLAHDYVDVEIDRLYLAVTQVLPAFRDQIARVLSDLEKNK